MKRILSRIISGQAEMNLPELEQNILRRIASVDLTSGVINKPVVAHALETYLEVLGCSPRPIAWAKDGTHAYNLVSRSDLPAIEEELRGKFERVFHWSAQRAESIWTDARDAARTAGHGAQFDLVKGLMRGYSVRLSVPWRFYEGRFTGDRSRRTNPEDSPVWQAASDALEYAARARAECAWVCNAGIEVELPATSSLAARKKTHPSYEHVWIPFVEAFVAGLWLFWITPAEVIVLTRPRLQLNAEQLHAANGPAVSWVEGEEQHYFLNGVHVPREIVETPAREMDPRILLKERNVQVRREIVRKIGLERVCQALEAQCLDREGTYELLLLDLQDGRTRPFLKMKNPSIGVYHIEGVAPECCTVAEALAWRNQSDVPPSVLT